MNTRSLLRTLPPCLGIALLGANSASAQLTESWRTRFDAEHGTLEAAFDVAVDSKGAVVLVGSTQWAGAASDLVVGRITEDGVPMWLRRFDGPAGGADEGLSVAVDSKDHVIAAGWVETLDGYSDLFVVKLDPAGNVEWTLLYDGPASGYDYAAGPNALAVDSNDRILVTGAAENPGTGPDIVTLKISPKGQLLWERLYDAGLGGEVGTDLAVDALGNVVVAGYGAGGSNNDFLVLRYGPHGQLLWDRRVDGLAGLGDGLWAMQIDSLGQPVVTGSSENPGQGEDVLTAKFDTQGNLLWKTQWVQPNTQVPFALAIDAQGNVAVTGGHDLGFGTEQLFVQYLDAQGAIQWTKTYQDPEWRGLHEGTGVGFDASGKLYVGGLSWGGWDTGMDGVVLEYSPAGTLLWEQRIDGDLGGDDGLFQLAVRPAGAVVGVGITHAATGGSDLFAIQYGLRTKTGSGGGLHLR